MTATDASGRVLSRADLAELERMNEENRQAAEKARRGKSRER